MARHPENALIYICQRVPRYIWIFSFTYSQEQECVEVCCCPQWSVNVRKAINLTKQQDKDYNEEKEQVGCGWEQCLLSTCCHWSKKDEVSKSWRVNKGLTVWVKEEEWKSCRGMVCNAGSRSLGGKGRFLLHFFPFPQYFHRSMICLMDMGMGNLCVCVWWGAECNTCSCKCTQES